MQKVILVIDDDEMNLQIAKMILERKLSCKVIGVDNGMAGIEVLRNQRVNLVLLDIMMPDLDGIETLQKIRADEKIKNVPVMMLTASGDIENIQKVGTLGVKDYIKKPFMPADLIKRVKDKLAEADKLTEHVLIIGNDADTLKSVREFVEENFPHEVFTASTAYDALKILTEEKVNLVVALADMKFLDGFRVLNFLAHNKKFAELPLIITAQAKLGEILDKITEVEEVSEVDKEPPEVEKVPKDDKVLSIVEKVSNSASTRSEKKKIANVVTNLIGYEIDVHI